MRELEQHTKVSKEVTIPIPDKQKMIGSTLRIKGLKMYELDLKTALIYEAQFESSSVTFPTKENPVGRTKHKLLIKDNHIYCQALNIKVAGKKFAKMLKIKGLQGVKIKQSE